MSNRVVVIDYGIGNVFSVCNALQTLGADVSLTRSLQEIRDADRLILPGVGAFACAMEALDSYGLADSIKLYVETGKPFLGICIGMQLLMDRSMEFGQHEGLGFIAGKVERILNTNEAGERVRVPHIGWTNLREDQPFTGTPLASVGDGAVYFVHSYHCKPDDDRHVLSTVDYDGLTVTAAIRHENVIGVQFHPERSGIVGKNILNSFVKDGISGS